jgi:hypothetical protein
VGFDKCVEALLDLGHRFAPSDERKFKVGAPGTRSRGDHTHRLPGVQRLGLALDGMRAGVLVEDRPVGHRPCHIVDQHRPWWGDGLNPGRGVDRIADHLALGGGVQLDGRLAGEHPRAQSQLEFKAVTEVAHRRHQLQRGALGALGAHGALGVVLAGHGCAPQRHHS